MERKSRLDKNLIFGERHDQADVRNFLTQHISDFYTQGYRILVIEVSGQLQIGDLIDTQFSQGTILQKVMDTAAAMVKEKKQGFDTLLDNIGTGIQPVLVPGSRKKEFGLLVKSALQAGFRIQCIDPADDPAYDAKRVQNYDEYVAPRLKVLQEKWLSLVGDDHIAGLAKLLTGENIVLFPYANLKAAIETGKLKNISDLDALQPVSL